jgi:hypothetical protein
VCIQYPAIRPTGKLLAEHFTEATDLNFIQSEKSDARRSAGVAFDPSVAP